MEKAVQQWTRPGRGSWEAQARAARDYANGWTGVLSLALGFMLQAAGYVVYVAGHRRMSSGAGPAALALLFGLLGALVPVLGWLLSVGASTRDTRSASPLRPTWAPDVTSRLVASYGSLADGWDGLHADQSKTTTPHMRGECTA